MRCRLYPKNASVLRTTDANISSRAWNCALVWFSYHQARESRDDSKMGMSGSEDVKNHSRSRRSALPIVLIACALRLYAAAGVNNDDWPQFRGPTGQGHSTETGLPIEWSESHNIVWKTPVPGRGWSSPVVAAGRVWLTTAVTDGTGSSLRVPLFDREK